MGCSIASLLRPVFQRSELALLLGAGMLLTAALLPWFVVPAQVTLEANLSSAVQGEASGFQLPMQIAAGAVGVWCLAMTLLGRRVRLSRVAGCLLILFLAFPYFVMIWEPAKASRAMAAHEDVGALRDEMEPQLPLQESLWRFPYLMHFAKQGIRLFLFLIPNPEFLQFSNLDVLFRGFGYHDAFMRFVGRGWLFGLAGALVVLSGDCLRRRESFTPYLLADLRVLGVLAAAAFGGMLVPLLAANYYLYWGQELVGRGLYAEAAESYEKARSIIPLLDYDMWFQRNLGESYFRMNRKDQAAYHIYAAQQSFEAKEYHESRLAFEEARRVRPGDPSARDGLSRAFINLGVLEFNKRAFHLALSYWEQALTLQPVNYKAHHASMLAFAQVRDLSGMRREANFLIAFNAFFQFQHQVGVSQGYTHLAWAAYLDGDYGRAVEYLQTAIEPDRW